MTNERLKQIREIQWEEGISMIAYTILCGHLTYNDFLLECKPDNAAIKYVDDYLKGALKLPENKGKIIPGFNG